MPDSPESMQQFADTVDAFVTEVAPLDGEGALPVKQVDIYSIADEWFNPRPQLMKHLIVIQMIAALIVTAFLIIVEGQNMSPSTGMGSIIFFMLLASMGLAMYYRF